MLFQVFHLTAGKRLLCSASFKEYSGDSVTKPSDLAAIERCGFRCLRMEQCMSFIYRLDKQTCEPLILQAELFTEMNEDGKDIVYQRGKSYE